MTQPFSHSADSLQSFFSQAGRAFYVPYYQRNYSWDEENAKKLVLDIFTAIRRTLTKPDNSIFLGTVILHDEKNVEVGVHTDTPNLLTKVSNVVDGQQRITSIAMLACVINECISAAIARLDSFAGISEVQSLAGELADQQSEIRDFYSVEIKKNGASPPLKPLIIRAGDITANPVSDQWTLKGASGQFYKSNTSSFFSGVINGLKLKDIKADARVRGVVDVFSSEIKDAIAGADFTLASGLLLANANENGSLFKFMAYPPAQSAVQGMADAAQKAFCGGMLLLAACAFLKNACNLVVIECKDLDLAFDMFQSLNATGTPLTAFEVFKPTIVRDWGASYATTIKGEVDRIERVFETKSNAGDKEDLTDRVIVSSALVYNGKGISQRFSDERDWLFDSMPPVQSPDLARSFVGCLADQAEYCQRFILPRRTAKNSPSFALANHLGELGLTNGDADLAALCVYYLRDAQNNFAHAVLSVFYAKLLRSQAEAGAKCAAAAEFLAVCKATAAFFTLWMGALQGRFPDNDYRQLFQSTPNMSVASGVANQTEAFLKEAYRVALARQHVYDVSSSLSSRPIWVEKAKNNAWYSRRAVCRFALFTASHDAAPDLALGREGLFVDGMTNSWSLLNCKAWHASEYEAIEHVATREKPAKLEFPAHFDESIYPGNYSVVDKIGNLSLLSIPVNSSIYSEWPDKVFFYWNLTNARATTTGPSAAALMAALGITALPPSLGALSAASNYLPHLAPLAFRGERGLPWSAEFIDRRSEHLCERVFDRLDSWLR